MEAPLLTVIVPVYQEEGAVAAVLSDWTRALGALAIDYRLRVVRRRVARRHRGHPRRARPRGRADRGRAPAEPRTRPDHPARVPRGGERVGLPDGQRRRDARGRVRAALGAPRGVRPARGRPARPRVDAGPAPGERRRRASWCGSRSEPARATSTRPTGCCGATRCARCWRGCRTTRSRPTCCSRGWPRARACASSRRRCPTTAGARAAARSTCAGCAAGVAALGPADARDRAGARDDLSRAHADRGRGADRPRRRLAPRELGHARRARRWRRRTGRAGWPTSVVDDRGLHLGRRRPRPVQPLRVLRRGARPRARRRLAAPRARGVDLDPRALRAVSVPEEPPPARPRGRGGGARGPRGAAAARGEQTGRLRRPGSRTRSVPGSPSTSCCPTTARSGAIRSSAWASAGWASAWRVPDLERVRRALREGRGPGRLGAEPHVPLPGARRHRRHLARGRGAAAAPSASATARASRRSTRRRARSSLATGERLPFDTLVSSMPLDRLCAHGGRSRAETRGARRRSCTAPSTSSASASRARCRRRSRTKCWMYFPDPASPYYRVTVFSNYSPAQRARGLLVADGRGLRDASTARSTARGSAADVVAALRADGLVPASARGA